MIMEQKRDSIVVTGFGPFLDNETNPSWDAIKDGRLRIDLPNVNLVTKRISVEYEAVDRDVEELWNVYTPVLMVHVGLAASFHEIRIEKQARCGPYIKDDIAKNAPHKDLRLYDGGESNENKLGKSSSYSCKPIKFDSSRTCINIDRACERLNELHSRGKVPIPFRCSDDAGLYVCEYIYQKSLRICDKTVFIHVPKAGDRYSLDDISLSLKYAIETIMNELNEI